MRRYLRRFNYTAGKRYDNSVTQYAVLGLYSAHLCGIPISPTVWFGTCEHTLWDQYEVKGVEIPLTLVSLRDYERQRVVLAKKNKRRTHTVTTRRRKLVEAWGWPYSGPLRKKRGMANPLTGSMTAAGITDLAICEATLHGQKKDRDVRDNIRQGILRGFAWIHENFSVRDNPHREGQYSYYLYGLERAAELAQVALIGERDWYFEGAIMLLGMQRKNGSFTGGLPDNCFAVLFLKQAAPPLPVLTGR